VHVILVEPCFPTNQREFARALAAVGATVIGIGERPKESLDGELRNWLTHYEQIGSVCDEPALERTVRGIQKQVSVERLEATIEAHIEPAARVREACGIPGTTTRTAYLCRDKPAMKEVLRAAGVPCAQSTGAASADEVRAFAAKVGFPLIIKPRSAAGASGTHRADSTEDLERIIRTSGVDRGAPVAVEEFIEGHEGFYDTLTIEGEVVHEFVSHYYPNVFATNRVQTATAYAELKEMGRKVIEALGIGTSATHMEWFYGPKGLKFSEIGCRPPGVRTWDLYCAGDEMDVYREWAMAVVHGRPSQTPSHRYAAGIIALRPDRDGSIQSYEGLEEIQRTYGAWIIDSHLPPAGTPTQGVEAGYMANAWMRLRHPDYDELRHMLDTVGRTVKVHAA
jgi:formate-dependent phosphoribosylglycinamide formyltransferase (GAR transformylase)